MRLLHVVGTIDPANGGPPLVSVRLAAAQAALGHEVSILTYVDPAAEERIARSIARVPGVEQVRRVSLPKLTRYENYFAPIARRMLNNIVPRLDFIHIHGVWERLLIATAAAAQKHAVPYCWRPAGMLDPWSLSQGKWKKKLAMAMSYGPALRNAAFIHALNPDEARLIEPLKLARSEIIPNGIFTEEIEPLPAAGEFRAKFPQLGDRPFIFFLARLHMKKGLDFLFDAFRILAPKIPNLAMVIAGPDDGARAWTDAQVAQHQLADKVFVVGGLYAQDRLAAMVDATVFCLPSRQEGFPVAALESLACGLPVVISEDSHFPQVASGGAGFVVPLDAAQIAAGLEKIITDAAQRQRMSEAGREMIRRDFTWQRVAEQTTAAYERYRT